MASLVDESGLKMLRKCGLPQEVIDSYEAGRVKAISVADQADAGD